MPQDPDMFDLDEMDDDDDDNDPAPPQGEDRVSLKREDAKRMRGAAKRAKTLEAELNMLKRERAFEKAGVDLSTKAGQFFALHYDAEVTDPEKIRLDAEEVGVPLLDGPKPKADGPDLNSGEDDSTKERQNLAAGGVPDDGKAPKPDPKKESIKLGKELIANGASEQEGIAAAIAAQAQAAMDGDERAIIKSSF